MKPFIPMDKRKKRNMLLLVDCLCWVQKLNNVFCNTFWSIHVDMVTSWYLHHLNLKEHTSQVTPPYLMISNSIISN